MNKDFTERIIELLKDDKELHDAAIRMLNSYSELLHEQAIDRKEKREAKREDAKKG